MKLAVLDKDATLVLPKSGNKFVQNPTDQILMVGAIQGCQRLIDAGYVLAIASNQGGVASRHKTLEEAISEMGYCLSLLAASYIEIDRAMFCPDFEGEECHSVFLNDAFAEKNGDAWENGDMLNSTHAKFRIPSPGMHVVIDANSVNFRKPSPGMLILATQKKALTDAWMIGDREEDRGAAEAAGFGFLDAGEWRKGASPWII
jgi:D-glycero-D-manno-heptose 1,7-bisphosphate phosphatase